MGDFQGGVFISYRRELAQADAEKLHDLLKEHLGEHRVFFDRSEIKPGDVFPERIEDALRKAHMVLFVIAPGWAEEFRKREQSPDVDWVRREVQITQERRGNGMVNPPNVRVVLVDGATMPAPSELPDELQWLASIDACQPCAGDNWHQDPDWRQEFLVDVNTEVPYETAPLDDQCLATLAAECGKSALEKLTKWANLEVLKDLRDEWSRQFSPANAIDPAKALQQLRTALESLNNNYQATLTSLGPGMRKDLRNHCIAIVAELLRLGACRLASELPALGNHTSPIAVKELATQFFATAHSQGGRKARISSEAGTLNKVNVICVERAIDQGTVTAGILEDASSTILDQLWRMVPELSRYQPTFPADPKNPEDIADLREALNAMSEDDPEARVTIALQGDSTSSVGAETLRRWLSKMELEIDVLVRTGRASKDFGAKELKLIGPAWRCLIQIEKLSND